MLMAKDAVEVGEVVKAGQECHAADLFVGLQEELAGVFDAHGDDIIGEAAVRCLFKEMAES